MAATQEGNGCDWSNVQNYVLSHNILPSDFLYYLCYPFQKVVHLLWVVEDLVITTAMSGSNPYNFLKAAEVKCPANLQLGEIKTI